MAWYNFGKQQAQQPIVENKKFDGFRAISTEGLDLSKPFVDDYFNRGFSFVHFGETNLHPQILNQLYVSSPMHQACCNFKKYSLIGDGYEWQGMKDLSMEEQIKIKQFENMSSLQQSSIKITLDWIKHGRVIALVRYSKKYDKYTHFRLVDPESIRNNLVGLFQDRPTRYFYSRDWTRSMAQMELKPYALDNYDEWQVLEIRNEVGGFRSYGVPDWMSSANWQSVSADLGLLHKSAIENGIQPSVIWKFPYEMSPDERYRWEQAMKEQGKGARNYGRAIKVEAQGKDLMPELEVVKTTDNHKIFEQTSKEQKEEIAISHNINPALMGVRIAGSLGATEEIEFSAKQFEKIWINENRGIVERFINEIAEVCGIKSKMKIKKTNVIDIAEAMINDSGEAIAAPTLQETALNGAQISSLMLVIERFNEGVIDRDSAVSIITSAFPSIPFEKAQGMIPEKVVPTDVNGQPTEELESKGNDNLRGLTAKENMDMMRIVRDFSKGRLAEPLARTRLAAYGIDEMTINELMTTT